MASLLILGWNCLEAWFYLYSIFNLCILENVTFIVSTFLIGSTLIFCGVQYLKIPPPDEAIVKEVLGPDPFYETGSTLANGISQSSYPLKSVAHRGAALDAPENSISAFRKVKEKGCGAIEFDVSLTSDGVPILFHDDRVDRITNGTGEVSQMTWDELKELDISTRHPFSERYKGEKIALFDDAISECIKLGLKVFIDIKSCDQRIVSIILDTFKNHKELYSTAVVSSFNVKVIYKIRKADPQITCSIAWRPYFFSYSSYNGADGESKPHYNDLARHICAQIFDCFHTWALTHFAYAVLGISAILLQKDNITIEIVRMWRERGVRVIAWTVNYPLEKQYFSRILKITYMTDTLDGEHFN